MKNIIFFILAVVLFSGCSTKKYFDPEDVQDEINVVVKDMDETIKSFQVGKGVALQDGNVLVSSGKLDTKLPEGFSILNYENGTLLASSNKDLLIDNTDNLVGFSNEVVAATKKDNLIALVFIDNSIALYDTTTKKIILKEYYSHSFLNDIKIANPKFMSNVVLFPTLDGKVIVVGLDTKKVIRNITVSTDGDIKNIIYLGVVNGNLIAASSNKILSLGNTKVNTEAYDINSVVASDDHIYISTIDGFIIKLDSSLNEVGSEKFKFAKFFTMVHTDGYVYALESQGFIVAIEDDFKKHTVYEFDFDNEQYAVAVDKNIYFDDKFIEIK